MQHGSLRRLSTDASHLDNKLGHEMHPAELKVNAAIASCRTLLSSEEYKLVWEYSALHGEYGLAIETLADVLGENETQVQEIQLSLITEAFSSTDLHPGRRLEFLRELSPDTGGASA